MAGSAKEYLVHCWTPMNEEGQDCKWKLLVPVSLAAAGDEHKNGDWK